MSGKPIGWAFHGWTCLDVWHSQRTRSPSVHGYLLFHLWMMITEGKANQT